MFEHDKKNDDTQIKEPCQCDSLQGLFMRNRQLSLVVAAVLLMNFGLFMGGYFLGQKNAIALFSSRMDQESFGDQIYSSLCSLCDDGQIEEDEEVSDGSQDSVDINEQDQADVNAAGQSLISTNESDSKAASTALGQYCTAIHLDAQDAADDESSEVVGQSTEYFAQLAGFGTARAAQQFAQRLLRQEIQVVVKKRQSRSSRGKFVSWYQVVTEKFDDRDQLQALVQRLEKEEKLKGVHIVSC